VSRAPGDWTARLNLDPTAFVAPGAMVVGDVTMGRHASVWFNAVVRGDTAPISIGEDSNLQDVSVVHVDEAQPAVIGARVTIGHRAVIHGCAIEDECLIGMGSIVLSGARIGAGSLIGAGALVREGQVVPPGSLALGLPARVVGQVTAAQRESIRGSSAHYAALARSYLGRGFARPHPASSSDAGTSDRAGGSPSRLEWSHLLSVLAEGPGWVARRLDRYAEGRWAVPPGPGRWSALEVLCHLRDTDREVLVPRLERMLREDLPEIPFADLSAWPAERRYCAETARAVLAAWRDARRTLVARLTPLGPAEWDRVGIHSRRGYFPLGAMVRDWVEHDLGHLHQMSVALGETT
jgi:carbonic anhydrase/acetyltransferase-like protein (isoleucine patch superfamily)